MAITEQISEVYSRALGYFKTPGVIKKSDHPLKMGSQSDFFGDFDYLLNDPRKSRDIILLYLHLIKRLCHERRVDCLAFMEKATSGVEPTGGTIGAIRLASEISNATQLPNIVVRLSRDMPAEKIKLTPYEENKPRQYQLNGAYIVLITDHCSSGSEVLKAARSIEEMGGRVTDVVTYTIRSDIEPELARWDEIDNRDIDIHSVFTLPEDAERAGVSVE